MNTTCYQKQRWMILLLAISHFATALIPPSQRNNPSSIHLSPSTSSLSLSIQKRRRNPFSSLQRKYRGQLFVATSEPELSNEDTSSFVSPTKTKRIKQPSSTAKRRNRRSNGNSKNAKSYPKPRDGNNKNTYFDTKPWQADFKTSIRTQGRIKKAYSTRFKTRSMKAKEILKVLLSTHPTQVNAANVICALTFSAKALGTTSISKDTKLRSMLFEVLDILNHMVQKRLLNTRQLCNACWAIAKHYDRDDKLLPNAPEAVALSEETAVGTAVQVKIEERTWLEKSQAQLEETLDEIAVQLTDILDEEAAGYSTAKPAQVGEICMASWAYGKLRHRKKPPGWQLPPQTGRLSKNKNGKMKPKRSQDTITFESWGRSFGSDDETEIGTVSSDADNDVTNLLFDVIAAALCRPIQSNLTLLDEYGFPLEDFRTRLEDCSWSELANLGWAFAAHGSCESNESQTLLQNLAREASRRLHAGGKLTENVLTRDLAQLIWSLGTLQADNFQLADDLILLVEDLSNEYLDLDSPRASFSRAARPLTKWSCQDLVQVALALGHARIDEQPLLRAIYKENNHRLLECKVEDASAPYHHRKCFHPWEVSILLWAQARLYLKEEQGEMFDDFVRNASQYILGGVASDESLQSVGIGPQEQANIVWSLTVLQRHQSTSDIELIQRIFKEAAESFEEHQYIQLEHAHQLWQAYFIMEEESPEAIRDVPTWFSQYLSKKWNLEKTKIKRSSARHRSISQCLQLMGVEHFNEHDEDIDVAIVLKQNALWTHETQRGEDSEGHLSVAVEFDGPNHFAREKKDENGKMLAQPRALGHSVLKYRLLKKQGWTVVRIPYYEFDKIPFWASMERQRYLQRKLKTHGNIKFSEVDVSEYKALIPNRKSRFD